MDVRPSLRVGGPQPEEPEAGTPAVQAQKRRRRLFCPPVSKVTSAILLEGAATPSVQQACTSHKLDVVASRQTGGAAPAACVIVQSPKKTSTCTDSSCLLGGTTMRVPPAVRGCNTETTCSPAVSKTQMNNILKLVHDLHDESTDHAVRQTGSADDPGDNVFTQLDSVIALNDVPLGMAAFQPLPLDDAPMRQLAKMIRCPNSVRLISSLIKPAHTAVPSCTQANAFPYVALARWNKLLVNFLPPMGSSIQDMLHPVVIMNKMRIPQHIEANDSSEDDAAELPPLELSQGFQVRLNLTRISQVPSLCCSVKDFKRHVSHQQLPHVYTMHVAG
eukprot:353919-Chlamydomonas_euryale.AAC.6